MAQTSTKAYGFITEIFYLSHSLLHNGLLVATEGLQYNMQVARMQLQTQQKNTALHARIELAFITMHDQFNLAMMDAGFLEQVRAIGHYLT